MNNKFEFSRKELLLECWTEQRQEINYRRDREQLVFQTSATVWVGLLGALLVNGQSENPVLLETGVVGKAVFTAIILLTSILTNGWIKKQRNARTRNQKALAEIQKQCGCFDADPGGSSVLPVEFHDDWAEQPIKINKRSSKGSFKYFWCWLLPIFVIIAVWLLPLTRPSATQATSTPAPSTQGNVP